MFDSSSSPPSVPPNIVFILADDLGYGDIRALNPQRSRIPTPNLDRLAGEGISLTDCHSTSAVCTPSRYSILTGRYCWRTRLKQGVLSGYDEPLIEQDQCVLPGFLRQNGYHTACIGKWHLGFTIEPPHGDAVKDAKTGVTTSAPVGARTLDGPLSRGFDQFFGFHHARVMNALFEGTEVKEWVEPVEMLPKIAARSVEYIHERSQTKTPFFLYLSLNSPHTPIVPAPEWQGKSGIGDYGDFVMQTDDVVGQVLQAIEDAGIEENTLVIFTSDNGCSPKADVEAMEAQGHFPSAHFRGYKSDIWDGGHRIPFLARWPGRIEPGSHSAALACLADILPTVSAILDVPLPEGAAEDAINMLPVLLQETGESRESVVHHSFYGQFAIRDKRWKLVLCPGSGGWTHPTDVEAREQALPGCQLYDMQEDEEEKCNFYQPDHPEALRLEALLKTITA